MTDERKKELLEKIKEARSSEELEEVKAELEKEAEAINEEVPAEEVTEEVTEEVQEQPKEVTEQETEIGEEEERNLIRVGTEEIVPIGNSKEERNMNKYDAEARAFAKKCLGRNDFTEDEKRALGDAVSTTATEFTQSAGGTQGINNTGLFIPKSIIAELEQRAENDSPIWRDVRKLRVRGNVDVPYLYAGDDAAWYAELSNTANEGNEYKAITLVGRELAKNIEITWLVDQMTPEGFLDFIVDELYEKMFKAKVTAIVYGTGATYKQPTGLTNGLSPVTTGDTPIDTIADAKATLSTKAKKGAKAYVSPAVADTIRYYKATDGHYPYLMGLPAGIEEDPYLQNNDIVVGNMRNYVWNEQEEIRLDVAINMPKRTVMYGTYQVCDGGAKAGAFAYGQYTVVSA